MWILVSSSLKYQEGEEQAGETTNQSTIFKGFTLESKKEVL
jgi:hypothetical protein